ncbi:hypothetical protein DFH06DRAFT_1472809 [Mycena polygramma]|nr:hypothetical protein DFH06DRAFT_1472809 [Mycena polygramma]
MAVTTNAITTAAGSVKPEAASTTSASASPSTTNSSAAGATSNTANATAQGQPKCRARRANPAGRRVTHNAVERMRRETLNGRFLVRLSISLLMPDYDTQTLASMLPPLAMLRRPSMAAIVHTSIAMRAGIASLRYRICNLSTNGAPVPASRTWTPRPLRSPRRHHPHRGRGFDFTIEDGLELEGEDKEGLNDDDNGQNNTNSPKTIRSNEGSASPMSPQKEHQQFAGMRSKGPTPPPAQAPLHAAFSHPMHALEPLSIKGNDTVGSAEGKGYLDAPESPGAADDLAMGFDGMESLLLPRGCEEGDAGISAG